MAISEADARKATRLYFQWHITASGSNRQPSYIDLKKKCDHSDDKTYWEFYMVTGGRKVFVREVMPGRVEVWRSMMPMGTFTIDEIRAYKPTKK